MTCRYHAVAFDLDGTLIDSIPELAAALNVMRIALGGSPVSDEEASHWVGNGVPKLIERGLPAGISDDARARAPALFHEAYLAELGRHGGIFDGVPETLTALKAIGLKLAVVTNKRACYTEPLLARLGLAPFFDVIVSGDTTAAVKPDPAPLWYAAREMGVEPAHCLMVGDSRNDIIAARAAGMDVVGLTYGYNYGEDIALSCPDHVFDHFAAVCRVVGGVSTDVVGNS